MERNPETRRVASKERSRLARQRAREAMTVPVLSEERVAKRAQQAEYTRRWREKRAT
jgi:hypothetical protein